NNTKTTMQRAISSIMGPSRASFPPTDTIETSGYYQLESELPGYKKQDIEVRVTNVNTLVLTGSLQEETTSGSGSDVEHSTHRRMHQVHQEARYLSVERNVIEYFSRVFTFSCNIDGDQVKATLQNGILKVLVPKSTAGSTHHINID
ncbi:HSP20-like chaperone, partial [Thamnidium elegans]